MGLARFIGRLFSPFSRRFSRSAENDAHRLGRRGERAAARHLRKQGYRVLYRNFRGPKGGEVDLVCRHGDVLVFVEVKTRSSLKFGRPADAVTSQKQKLIIRGALAWLHLLHNPQILFRFDIVEVVAAPSGLRCTIVEDAFRLPDSMIY